MSRIKKLLALTLILIIPTFFILTKPSSAQFNKIIETIVGNPDAGGGSGGSGSRLTCDSGNYRSCLTSQFNISIRGNPPETHLKAMYNGFSIWSGYKTFLNLFRKASITITLSTYSTCGADPDCSSNPKAWAVVYMGGDMVIYRSVFESTTRYQNYFFIHEPAHTISWINPNFQNYLYKQAYDEGKARNCFNSYFTIKTYPPSLLDGTPRRRITETWGDSVANSFLCRDNAVCPANGIGAEPIPDFPDTCSFMYNYSRNVLD